MAMPYSRIQFLRVKQHPTHCRMCSSTRSSKDREMMTPPVSSIMIRTTAIKQLKQRRRANPPPFQARGRSRNCWADLTRRSPNRNSSTTTDILLTLKEAQSPPGRWRLDSPPLMPCFVLPPGTNGLVCSQRQITIVILKANWVKNELRSAETRNVEPPTKPLATRWSPAPERCDPRRLSTCQPYHGKHTTWGPHIGGRPRACRPPR